MVPADARDLGEVGELAAGTFYPLILGVVFKQLPPKLAILGIGFYATNILGATYVATWFEDWVTDAFTWPWIFWTPGLLVVAMFAAVRVGIPPAPDEAREWPSFAGLCYFAFALAFHYVGLDQGERLDWLSSGVVVVAITKLDTRVVLACGLSVLAVSCFLATGISSAWTSDEFFRLDLLDAVGQPTVVVALVASIVFVSARKGALARPFDITTLSAVFQSVRLVGGVALTALLRHLLAVRADTHLVAIAPRVDPGNWQTAERAGELAVATANGWTTTGAHLGDALRRAVTSVDHEVFTLAIRDCFALVGTRLLVVTVLLALARPMSIRDVLAAVAGRAQKGTE